MNAHIARVRARAREEICPNHDRQAVALRG